MADKKRKRIAIINGGREYDKCFEPHGDVVHKRISVKDNLAVKLSSVEVVVFTGGADVSPRLYDEQRHPMTRDNIERDMAELRLFKYCKTNKIPMVGICRGSQFLTVMNGGKLVQHITNHGIAPPNGHDISCILDKMTVEVTSTHHQMMYPWTQMGEFQLLAYSEGRSSGYEGVPSEERRLGMLETNFSLPPMEPEAVWWPSTKCLLTQFHPELMDQSSDGAIYYQKLLQEYIFK